MVFSASLWVYAFVFSRPYFRISPRDTAPYQHFIRLTLKGSTPRIQICPVHGRIINDSFLLVDMASECGWQRLGPSCVEASVLIVITLFRSAVLTFDFLDDLRANVTVTPRAWDRIENCCLVSRRGSNIFIFILCTFPDKILPFSSPTAYRLPFAPPA